MSLRTSFRSTGILLLLCLTAGAQFNIVDAVRAAIAQKDLAGAEKIARAYQARVGPRSDVAAAISWLARGSLELKSYDRADAFAAEAGKMASQLSANRKLDNDPWLPTAAGASIEVHAQVMAARGERGEAVVYLQEQAKRYAGTSLTERIRKNINLLSLEGKSAPPLEASQWVGANKPAPLAAFRGRPVLLFFWAHWCGDCKAEVAILANVRKRFAAQGLTVIAPTRYYGYVAEGEDASPEKEKPYIERVREQFYRPLSDVAAPLSAANFATYGASSTPTLVLIDRAGVVRWYHPGAVNEAELSKRIAAMLVN